MVRDNRIKHAVYNLPVISGTSSASVSAISDSNLNGVIVGLKVYSQSFAANGSLFVLESGGKMGGENLIIYHSAITGSAALADNYYPRVASTTAISGTTLSGNSYNEIPVNGFVRVAYSGAKIGVVGSAAVEITYI